MKKILALIVTTAMIVASAVSIAGAGEWQLRVRWHGGVPLGSGREWVIYQGLERDICELHLRQVRGPISRIWCERS
jgi:hypothetical protein